MHEIDEIIMTKVNQFDDTRSYIVFSTMFMSFELSSGDFV